MRNVGLEVDFASFLLRAGMLFFLSLLILFNLAVGYALGVYLGPPPALPLRKKGSQQVDSEAADADEEFPEPAEEPSVEVATTQATIALPESGEAGVLAGLQAFQAQLAGLEQELANTADDAEAFGENAKHLQQANHDYLATAQSQLEKLDADGLTTEVMTQGVQQIDQASKQIDELVEAGMDDEMNRAEIINSANAMTEAVGQLEEGMQEKLADLKGQTDPETGLALLDSLLLEVDALLAEDGVEQQRTAVAVQIDDLPADTDPDLAEAVLAKLGEIIAQQVGDPAAASRVEAKQFLLLPDPAELSEIAEELDSLRKLIEATTFVRDDQQVNATITCAIADMPGAESREALLARLEGALSESANQGGNQTFHHDGSFSAVIEESGAEADPQTIDV